MESIGKRCGHHAAIVYILFALAFAGLHTRAWAQWVTPSAPSIISSIGTLHAPDSQPAKTGVRYTLELEMAGERKWIFMITKARNLSYAATMNQIFNDLMPPRLSLTGDRTMLEKLSRNDIAGKPVLIQGMLYKDAHRLHVSKVELEPQD